MPEAKRYAACQVLSLAIRQATRPLDLTFKYCNFSYSCAQMLATGIAERTCVLTLRFKCNSFGADGQAALEEAMKDNPDQLFISL